MYSSTFASQSAMSKSSLAYNGMLLLTNSLVFQDRISSSQSSSKTELHKSKIKTGKKFSDYTMHIKVQLFYNDKENAAQFYQKKTLNSKEIHKQTRCKMKQLLDKYVNEYLKDDAVYASDLSECSTSLAHSSYPPGYCLALVKPI